MDIDNNTLRRFIAARDLVFTDPARIAAILNELSLLSPNSFIEVVESIYPSKPSVLSAERNTARYDTAKATGYTTMQLGCNSYRLPFQDFATAYRLELAGKHVDAIRSIRTATGAGLKEAKDFCEIVLSEIRAECWC